MNAASRVLRIEGASVAAVMLLVGVACESPAPPEARTQRSAESPAPLDVAPTIVSPEYRSRQRTIEKTGKDKFNEEALVHVQEPATGRALAGLAGAGYVGD